MAVIKMKIIHAIPYLSPGKGGPSVSVPALAQACALQGIDVTLSSQSWPEDNFEAVNIDHVVVELTRTMDRSGFGFSTLLNRRLLRAAATHDLMHVHGLWMYITHAAAKSARVNKKPYVVTPRGMLEPYIMSRSILKKRLVQQLFQDQDISKAACIHVLSASEAESVRSLNYRNPIAVIPNGIWPAQYESLPCKKTFENFFPDTANKKIILSMSRIHPKKGLLNLAEAWCRLAREFSSWHLVLAGPNELDHQQEIEHVLDHHGMRERVTFTGTLEGEKKMSALGAAELFVLPSFSEGFSMAILEAMICRLPVLLTPGCNFPESVKANAAIEALPNAKDVHRALRTFLEMNDLQRRQIGNNGCALVTSHYTWDRVASEMIKVYEWCLGAGTPPDCVEIIK